MRFEAHIITIRGQYQIAHPTGRAYHWGFRSLAHNSLEKEHASRLQEQAEASCQQVCAAKEKEEVKTAALPRRAVSGNAYLS